MMRYAAVSPAEAIWLIQVTPKELETSQKLSSVLKGDEMRKRGKVESTTLIDKLFQLNSGSFMLTPPQQAVPTEEEEENGFCGGPTPHQALASLSTSEKQPNQNQTKPNQTQPQSVR